MLGIHQKIKFGDIIYIALGERINCHLSSKGFSLKNNSAIEIRKMNSVNRENSCLKDYENDLFVVLPTMNENFLTNKLDLEERINLISSLFNITEDPNKMKDVNSIVSLYQNTKKDVYEQNQSLLTKIGQPILFGNKIILIHLKSLMFISTELTDRNSSKKKNNSIILTENYSDDCIFQFDCSKSNEKGKSEVFSNQNIYIRKCEKNIWANNPYLYYERRESIKPTKTKETKINTGSRREIELNLLRDISLQFTENFEMASPFQIKIFSNYIDPSSPCLSFCNPFWIVCQSVDKYIIIKRDRNESMEANLHTDLSHEYEDDSATYNNNETNYEISLVPVEKEKTSFNINGLFCVEQIDSKFMDSSSDMRMSPYIEFNNVIRFRHLATKKYLAFIKNENRDFQNKMKNPNSIEKNDTIFRVSDENSDKTRLKGTLTLKDIPDEDCNWLLMESYILLDRENYEKAKLEGMEYKSTKKNKLNQYHLDNEEKLDNDSKEDQKEIRDKDGKFRNSVKKKEILRIFHLKSKKFLSFEDMFGSNSKNEKFKKGGETVNPNDDEIKSKCTITLNKQPVDNDLFRLIHSSEQQSREMYLILNLTESFFNLVKNCTKRDITSFVKERFMFEEYTKGEKEHRKEDIPESLPNVINLSKNYLKLPSNKIIGEEYINENPSGINDIIKTYRKNWYNLKICFEILRDFCINNYDKRYDYSVPTGKPISARQDYLFEQGFLQMTIRFLEHAHNILSAYKDFQKITEQNALKFGNTIKAKENTKKVALNKRGLSIFEVENTNMITFNLNKLNSNTNSKVQVSANMNNSGNLQKSDVISNMFKEINNTIKSSFEFIASISKSNPNGKEYVFNKREIFWDYLLIFKESSQCLIEIIKDDENFINEIITRKKTSKTEKKVKSNEKFEKMNKRDQNLNIIDRLINYMNESKTYDVQSLTFFSKLMKSKNKGITSNQEEIFKSLIENKKEKFLLKITPKFNDRMFYVVYRTELLEYECRSLIDLCKYKNNLTEYEANIVLYLSAQLNLFADMCYGRNYTCIEKIREKFPLDLLIYHISQIDIYEPVIAGLINILNTTFIDIAPHSIIYPSMTKYVNDDRIVRSNKTPVRTFIPLDKLNMILCLALFNLYNLRHEKYYINTANIELLHNLISFRLYENVEYLSEENPEDGEDINLKQAINNHIVSIPNLKEAIREAIEETEKNFQQGKIIVDNMDDMKIKKKQFDGEEKSKGNSFFESIGFKFFQYSKESEEIGAEYLIYLMNFVNDFFLEQIVLRSIDSNMENKNIIAETFKSINRQDILTQNNMNYLMKTMVKIKHILTSNFRLDNDKSIFKSGKIFLINSMIHKDNPKRRVLILPIVKKISNVIDVILNLKIENTIDCILDNLISENTKVLTKLLKENKFNALSEKSHSEINKKNSAYKLSMEEFERRKNFKEIFLSDEYYLYQLFHKLDGGNMNSESEFYNSTIFKTMQELIVKILEINVDESMIKNLVKLLTRLSSQRKEIINSIKKIELITDKNDLKMFFLCDFLVKELSLLTEKTEVWMNVESCRVNEDKEDPETKFGFITNAMVTSANLKKKLHIKNKSNTREIKLVNFYLNELRDMFIDKQQSGGYLVFKSNEKIKLIQTILFSLQLNVTLLSLLGEVCQVYRINEMEIQQSNRLKKKKFINFKKQLDDLIRNIFNLLRCLIYKSENFQVEIQSSFLQYKSNEFLYNFGFIKILKEIVHSNPKFAINNAGVILEIIRKECNVKIFYNLFEKIKKVEELGKIVQNTKTRDLEKMFNENKIPKVELIKEEPKIEGKLEQVVETVTKKNNLFLKFKANSKLNQEKQISFSELTKFYKILKLMNNFVRSVKEERYIAPLIRQYEEIIKNLSHNESFAKIVASEFVSQKSKEIMRVKMKIFSQLIKMGYNLIRVNEKLKELIRKVFPVRILEEKILSLEIQLDVEKISDAIRTAKEAIDLNKKTIKLEKPAMKEKTNVKFGEIIKEDNKAMAKKRAHIEFQNIPKIFQGIFSFGDVQVDLTFIYLIKNFFKTKYHGSILFFFHGLDMKKKDVKTIKYFFEILERDIKIYEEIKELFEIFADPVFSKIIKIFKKNSFKYFFKGIFKIMSNIIGFINQDLFVTQSDYRNFMPHVQMTLNSYKYVFRDFIEENMELSEFKSIVDYINEKKENFIKFFDMNFNLNISKKEDKVVYKLDKFLNYLFNVKKLQNNQIIANYSEEALNKTYNGNEKNVNLNDKLTTRLSQNFSFNLNMTTKNKKYSEILSQMNKEEYFQTPYPHMVTLTIAFTGDFVTIIDKTESKNYVENELKLLAKYLNSKVNYHHPTYYYINYNLSLDNYIQPSFHLMNIFLKFIQESYLSKRHSNQVILLIKLFTYFIEADTEFLESYNGDGNKKSQSIYHKNKIEEIKEMCFKYRQNLFIKNGSVEVFLKIICEINQNFSKDVFQIILKFFNMVLAGGNTEAQEKFYELFDLFENSENLFLYLKQSFNIDIFIYLKSSTDKKETHKDIFYSELMIDELKFLQNLTENHFVKLQNYIRVQTSNKVSYNFVSIIVEYMNMLLSKMTQIHDQNKLNKKTTNLYYNRLISCLETLCEFLQGPCKPNQETLVHSKVIEIFDKILRETECVDLKSNDTMNVEDESVQKKSSDQSSMDKEDDDEAGDLRSISTIRSKKEPEISHVTSINSRISGNGEINNNKNLIRKNNNSLLFYLLKDFEKSMLIYKIGLVLLAAIEGRKTKDEIIQKLLRDFDLMIIYKKLAELYVKIKQIYNNKPEYFLYSIEEVDDESEKKWKKKFVVEAGFNLYVFLSSLYEIETEDTDFKRLFQRILKQSIMSKDNYCLENRELFYFYGKFKKAMQYFKDNCLKIEIFKDDDIQTVYFPKLNFFKNLTDEMLKNFREKANITSVQTKLDSLLSEKEDMYRSLKQLYGLESYFEKLGPIKYLFMYPKLLMTINITFGIIINIIILLSFTSESGDENVSRIRFTSLFGLSYDNTRTIYRVFGVVILLSSSLAFLQFMLKTAPLMYRKLTVNLYRELYETRTKEMTELEVARFPRVLSEKRHQVVWKNFKIFMKILSTLEVIYSIGYIGFTLLALAIHNFFFSYHLIEFIKSQSVLRNVLKSIYNPRKQLIFVFAFFLVLIYFYVLLIFYFFYEIMPSQSCDSILSCLATVYRETFTSGGNLGNFIETDPHNINEKGDIYRYLLDISFTIIMVWLVFQMISGLIVDTFSSLRKEQEEIEEDYKNYCFICGLKREVLEKYYTGRDGFDRHLEDHNVCSYFCYIFYLKEKNPSEYTGIESYVQNQIELEHISWLPIEKCLMIEKKKHEKKQNSI